MGLRLRSQRESSLHSDNIQRTIVVFLPPISCTLLSSSTVHARREGAKHCFSSRRGRERVSSFISLCRWRLAFHSCLCGVSLLCSSNSRGRRVASWPIGKAAADRKSKKEQRQRCEEEFLSGGVQLIDCERFT